MGPDNPRYCVCFFEETHCPRSPTNPQVVYPDSTSFLEALCISMLAAPVFSKPRSSPQSHHIEEPPLFAMGHIHFAKLPSCNLGSLLPSSFSNQNACVFGPLSFEVGLDTTLTWTLLGMPGTSESPVVSRKLCIAMLGSGPDSSVSGGEVPPALKVFRLYLCAAS